ncbi:MAG: hypothetical protein AB8B99_04860 [Phormidesmis sp.]
MDTNLIRVAWSVVDETPIPPKKHLSLAESFGAIVRELESRVTLSPNERQQIRQYLLERQHLITELYQ